jgi:sirohydrochlorin ferrochelatase
LLLVGHGAPRLPGAQAAVEAQAASLRRSGAFEEVACAFLSMPPAPTEALAALRGDLVCAVPLFMSDGYFVRAVAGALAMEGREGRRVLQARPVGLMPELTGVIERRALAACAEGGLEPGHCGLLLVAHGYAGSPASRDAARFHIEPLAAMGRFRWVDAAFLEEEPMIANRLAAHAGDLVAVGFFAAPGGHAAEDVPEALAADPYRGERRVLYTGAIGTDPMATGVIAAAAALAVGTGMGGEARCDRFAGLRRRRAGMGKGA